MEAERTSQARRVRPPLRDVALVAGSGLAMGVIFIVMRRAITDDGYITLAYAKNLALHLHWGLIPQETANTATSALNVFLLGGATLVTRVSGDVHPVLALTFVSSGLAMGIAWGFVRIRRALALPFWSAVLGTAVVLLDPFLLSSMGLETLLLAFLLVAMVAMAVEERPALFGVVAGLALLSRLDMILFAVPIALAAPSLRRSWLRVAIAAVLTSAPWFVFSWFALGSAIPDTLVIKLGIRGGWDGRDYLDGPIWYFERWPVATIITFVSAALGMALLLWWIGTRGWRTATRLVVPAALAVGGVLYFGVYSALRLPPFHWYYSPPTVALSIFLVIGLGALARGGAPAPRLVRLAPLAAGVALLLVVARVAVDIEHGIPWQSPLISTNYANPSDYTRVGLALRKRFQSDAVKSPGEIGTLAYFCDCLIVDEFSDRGRAAPVINDALLPKHNPAKRLLLKLNYLWFDNDQQPRPVAYHLQYVEGRAAPPGSWRVSSQMLGAGRLQVVPAAPPPP